MVPACEIITIVSPSDIFKFSSQIPTLLDCSLKLSPLGGENSGEINEKLCFV